MSPTYSGPVRVPRKTLIRPRPKFWYLPYTPKSPSPSPLMSPTVDSFAPIDSPGVARGFGRGDTVVIPCGPPNPISAWPVDELSPGTPTRMSPYPSPFTSPASDTAVPHIAPLAVPAITVSGEAPIPMADPRYTYAFPPDAKPFAVSP